MRNPRVSALFVAAISIGASPLHSAALRVVINEVHYHPADDLTVGEFVELFNHGDVEVDLSSWALQGAVTFTFPPGRKIASGEILVVAADPATVRARYGLPAAAVLGPFEGALSNGGDRLELWTQDGYLASYVSYLDSEPWPETPDGLGPSLERVSALREEDDAEAWAASIVVGGTPGEVNSVRIEEPELPEDKLFVPQGAVWRYWKGTAAPPAGWASTGFDDASWLSGPAGFGYDDGDDATVLNDMSGSYSTVFIRKAFSLANPASISRLSLSVLFDDGYVAYLNGTEVDRFNAPGPAGSSVAFDAVSDGFVEPPQLRTVDLIARRDLLVAGTNVLAVVGLNRARDNADFSLHPSLTGTEEVGGDATEFVAVGDVWRFHRGSSAPPATWRELSFVDDAWEEGPSGFGYGDNDDATVLGDMQNGYLAVFIRDRFQVADATKVTSLTLTVNYDDGFIAYLNGVEVARANVTTPGFDTPANIDHEAGAPQDFPIASPSSVLRTGVNVLAIEGHNSGVDSGDLSLEPSLSGITAPSDGPPPPPPPPEPPPRDVVLNEVQAAAGGAGWVELYNRTASPVDVGGRKLSLFPQTQGSYTLPKPTSVPAHGRVVINEAQLGFSLTNVPAIVFSTADGRFVDAINPRTAPASASTGRWPDGSDNRYVFSAPTKNAPNTLTLERRVVIHEIQYHPAPTNTGGEFIELFNRGPGAVDVSGWSFTRGVEYTFPAGTSIPAGGYLVLAHRPADAQAYYGIPLPLGPYTGQLRNDAETILLRDALRNPVDRVRYADEGSWPEAADGLGPSLELANAELENRYGPAWRASSGNGTPGAANSAHANDPPPIVVGVEHSPAIPEPTESVLVTATASDERALTSVTLLWRLDGAGGNATQVPMVDDGANDDGIAGNGVYGARIPPQADRTIVTFWIQAAAQGGQSVTEPAGAPDPAFLYQVEAPTPVQVRPVERIILRAADLTSLRTRGVGSNVLLPGTFVARGRAHYLRGVRYRGSSARNCNPLSYRIQFDHDDSLDGIQDLNLNGCNTQRQWIGLDFLSRTGLPTPQSWFRKISINGAIESEIYLRVEAIEESFLERVLPPDDAGGNLYRGENQANLDYRGADSGPYEENYEKHSNVETTDWSDVAELCSKLDAATTPDADFPAAVESAVDVDEWALFFAAFAILGSTENSILLDSGDDYFLYHRPSDGRWMLLPWDLDSCFDETTQPLFRPSTAQVRRFLSNRRYAPLYWCHVEALLESAFRSEVVEARIEHIAPLFSSGRISQLRGFEPARRAYIAPRISAGLTVVATSGGSACGSTIVTTGGSVALEGRAPGCDVTEVRVDGKAMAYDVIATKWSGSVSLTPGTTAVVTALDRFGAQVARLDVTVRLPLQGTQLPATVSSSRSLSAAQNPHVVSGVVTVGGGATLTVEAGAEVVFDQGATLFVDGRLVVDGTAADPVQIESRNCGTSQERIVLRGSGAGSRLSHCVISGMAQGPPAAAGITVDGPSLLIEDASFEIPSGSIGIEVRGNGSADIASSRFRGGSTAVVCGPGEASLEGCELRETAGPAVRAQDGGRLRLATCLLRNNATAVLATAGGSAELEHLTIYGAGIGLDLREAVPGAGSGSLTAHSLIVWSTPVSVAEDAGESASITYSDLAGQNVRAGVGNIRAEPRFVDTGAGDFHIGYLSPCRATGKDGTDMGAFPYVPSGDITFFRRCDANADGDNDLADAVFTLFVLFAGATEPDCALAMDCDGSGTINLTDVVFDLMYLFRGGASPPAPYPQCDEAPAEACAAASCSP